MKFVFGDIGKYFKIKMHSSDTDNIEYGSGQQAKWLYNHRSQNVKCIDIGELGWCVKLQAKDGSVGWGFLRDLLEQKPKQVQLALF